MFISLPAEGIKEPLGVIYPSRSSEDSEPLLPSSISDDNDGEPQRHEATLNIKINCGCIQSMMLPTVFRGKSSNGKNNNRCQCANLLLPFEYYLQKKHKDAKCSKSHLWSTAKKLNILSKNINIIVKQFSQDHEVNVFLTVSMLL